MESAPNAHQPLGKCTRNLLKYFKSLETGAAMAPVEAIADIKVIDVDTHVVEPADLWTSRVSTKKWGDKVPHVEWSEKRQEDIWLSADKVLGAAGAPASAGYEFAPPKYPPRISDAHPSTWRAEDRLAAMGEDGIPAQVVHPTG